MRRVLGACLALVWPMLSVGPASATAPGGGFCASVGAAVAAGTITDPALVEISGLAASRTVPDVLWVNNDSGDAPRLYAISTDGRLLGAYDVAGADAVDWEDIAVGPGPDAGLSYLYVGDIGQNGGRRDQVEVYRAPEPSAIAALGSLDAERIELTYPSGPEDAESLFVDPVTGDLVIITKQLSGVSRVLLASAAQLVDGATVPMQEIATITIPATGTTAGLPSTMATAADISSDGSTILLRTYQEVLAFRRPSGGSLVDAFTAAPCSAPQVDEPQGEAIGFAADGSGYYTASEIQLVGATDAPLTFFPITAAASPSTTTSALAAASTLAEATTTSTAAETTPTTAVSTSTDAPTTTEEASVTLGGRKSLAVLASIALLGAAATIVVVARRRRPT